MQCVVPLAAPLRCVAAGHKMYCGPSHVPTKTGSIMFHPPFRRVLLILLLSPVLAWRAPAADSNVEAEASRQRLLSSASYLASDELEGRGVGTKGLDRAAEYLAQRFAELGLNTQLVEGTPFQTFRVTTGAELGEPNTLALLGPPDAQGEPQQVSLQLGTDFQPLSIGGSAQLDLPLVFAGYGITAKDQGYDDYAGIDVRGKAVLVLRHEPQQDNPHSVFNGTDHSAHAPLVRKVSNAYEHGAAAVIFCTDEHDIRSRMANQLKDRRAALDELAQAEAAFAQNAAPSIDELRAHLQATSALVARLQELTRAVESEYDAVLSFRAGGDASSNIPVLHCRRSVIDQVVRQALGKELRAIEAEIDQQLQPASAELAGWRVQGQVTVRRSEVEVKNVLAVLEGEGPLAEETIVVGAHYDHLGYGGEGSLAPGVREVHNGADDNASGTAVLLEVAQRLQARGRKLPRRVLFAAFTAEERGLIGSAYYCQHPVFPLENTIAMLNLDMVGRMDGNKLIIQGMETAVQFEHLVRGLNQQYGFEITAQPGGVGPSDHTSFYMRQIPVLFFFTGTHPDYHRPSDDYDKLNLEGMRRVAAMAADLVGAIAETAPRPQYVATSTPSFSRGGDRPYFGSIPDFTQTGKGYAISGVARGSPAEKGGLQAGDVIIRLGESQIGSLEDFDSALRKYKAGDKVQVVVRRGEAEVSLDVVLDKPR